MIINDKIKQYAKNAEMTIYACSCTVGKESERDNCENCISDEINNCKKHLDSISKEKIIEGFVNSNKKVLNFDRITYNYFNKDGGKGKKEPLMASNDVIVFEENGDITFIEFKNVSSRRNLKLDELRDKIFSSIYMLSIMLNDNNILMNTQSCMNYILVYNKVKMEAKHKSKQNETSIEDQMITDGWTSKDQMNDGIGYFRLSFFKENIFKETNVYNQDEFLNEYVNKKL